MTTKVFPGGSDMGISLGAAHAINSILTETPNVRGNYELAAFEPDKKLDKIVSPSNPSGLNVVSTDVKSYRHCTTIVRRENCLQNIWSIRNRS